MVDFSFLAVDQQLADLGVEREAGYDYVTVYETDSGQWASKSTSPDWPSLHGETTVEMRAHVELLDFVEEVPVSRPRGRLVFRRPTI